MDKKYVRKEAIKATVFTMAICIAIEVVFIALVHVLSKNGVVLLKFDARSLIAPIATFDVPAAFLMYADFKKTLTDLEEELKKQEDEQNK